MTANRRAALVLELSEELLDAITDRVMARIATHEPREPEGFLDVAGAAEFLACPASRIYALTSSVRLPCHRDGSGCSSTLKNCATTSATEERSGREPPATGYSDSPTASRASALVSYSRISATLPSRSVNTNAEMSSICRSLALIRPLRWATTTTASPWS